MRRSVLFPVLGLFGLLAACVAPKAPAPVERPVPVVPLPPPPPPPRAANWMDWPLTPGDWSYRLDPRGSVASYGRIGAAPDFAVRCDKDMRRVSLSLPGVLDPGKAARITLRATEGVSSYPLANAGGSPPLVAATLAANDPFLDKIAFSRGRVLVQVDGAQDIVFPNWAEFARVVEDCRS